MSKGGKGCRLENQGEGGNNIPFCFLLVRVGGPDAETGGGPDITDFRRRRRRETMASTHSLKKSPRFFHFSTMDDDDGPPPLEDMSPFIKRPSAPPKKAPEVRRLAPSSAPTAPAVAPGRPATVPPPAGALPHTDADGMPVAMGDVVVVHGLQGRAELNGCKGTLRSFDSIKGRWAVQLPTAEAVLIKPGTNRL